MMETSEKVAWLSILVDLVLMDIKAALALLSSSIAVRADALPSLADGLSSVVILVGIKISKKASQAFPYGLYMAENRIKMAAPQVDRVLIHYQPQTPKHLTYAIPLAGDKRTISAHFGEAPFFGLCSLDRTGGADVKERNRSLIRPKVARTNAL